MGVHFYLIQIPERRLMDLDEADVPGLFHDAVRHKIGGSLTTVLVHEAAVGARLPIPALHLEKWWFPLHFFLTGQEASTPEEVDESSLLSRAILGGRGIGKELHQGPARYLWSNEVREISEALSALTREGLRRRYDDPSGPVRIGYHKAVKFYMFREPLDDRTFEYCFEGLQILAAYYRIAAARKHAMLLGLT